MSDERFQRRFFRNGCDEVRMHKEEEGWGGVGEGDRTSCSVSLKELLNHGMIERFLRERNDSERGVTANTPQLREEIDNARVLLRSLTCAR